VLAGCRQILTLTGLRLMMRKKSSSSEIETKDFTRRVEHKHAVPHAIQKTEQGLPKRHVPSKKQKSGMRIEGAKNLSRRSVFE
jgi:hypothetical protein